MKIITRLMVLTFLLSALPAGAADTPKLDTDDQKAVYALGVLLSRNLQPYDLEAGELDTLVAGLRDGMVGKGLKIEDKNLAGLVHEFAQSRRKLQAEAEKKAAVSFLESAAKEKGAVKTKSGLIIKEIKPGTGPSPKATDRVKVHYHGTLRDGTVFDSSVERGKPATFPLNRVVPCWTEGLQKMKVGGKYKLVCPSKLAYGDRGSPPKIKPGAPLVFEVELLEILPQAAAGMPPGHP